jgi:preprotein translocase subunit SecG
METRTILLIAFALYVTMCKVIKEVWNMGGASVLYTVLSIVYLLCSAALVTIILLQKKRSAGIGSLAGMGGSSQTYWDKNKARSFEGTLELLTKIGGAVFFVFSLVMCVLK